MTSSYGSHPYRRPPRRLPIRVALFPREDLDSLARRLGAANHLPPGTVHLMLDAAAPALTPLEALAALAGHPPPAVAAALARPAGPERVTHERYPASPCTSCAAQRTGRTHPVQAWRRIADYVCIRHQRWIAPYQQQLDLTRCPQIIHASTRHIRLARRLPLRQHIDAVHDAWHIVTRWTEGRHRPAHWGHRVNALLGTTGRDWHAPAGHPVFRAACYPDVVTLTGLLSSTRWKSTASNHHSFAAFADEAGRRLQIAYPDLVNGLSPYLRAWARPGPSAGPDAATVPSLDWSAIMQRRMTSASVP